MMALDGKPHFVGAVLSSGEVVAWTMNRVEANGLSDKDT